MTNSSHLSRLSSLADALLAKGLSAERVVELEYVPALAPPQPSGRRAQREWVAALAGLKIGAASRCVVLSGGYDCVARLHDAATGDVLASATCAGEASAIVGACAVGEGGALAATAAQDGSVRLWEARPDGERTALVERAAFLGAHGDSAACVAADTAGAHLCSGGWDGVARLWGVAASLGDGGDNGAEEEDAPKRRRTAGGSARKDARSSPPRELSSADCEATLEAHTQCVSGAAWLGGGAQVVTASWDRTVRVWDAARAQEARGPLYATKAVHCLAAQAGASGLVATGGVDPAVQLWDVRAAGGGTAAVRLAGHGGWVAGVAWAPCAGHILASAAHDGKVKVWDVRSSVPLATLDAHEGKALCVAWAGGDYLASGGADARLATFKHSYGEAATAADGA